jgi:hypothetical protein
VDAYDAARWTSYFVAQVGAAAALSGLLFVAVSINLEHVLAYRWLPGRAAETVVVLVDVLLVAGFVLVPGQSRQVLGAEIALVALVAWAIPVALQIQSRRHEDLPARWVWSRVLLAQLATLPFIVAGLSLLAGHGGGLYWTVAGSLFSFTAAVAGAWVLLVEIKR